MEGMERTAMTNTVAIVGKSRQVSQAELDKFSTVYTVGTNPIEAICICVCMEKNPNIPDREMTWGMILNMYCVNIKVPHL